jgi:transcriptional regulator with XRE-family HTH domain
MENDEDMLEYVKRKLAQKDFNTSEAVRRTGVARSTVWTIATGKASKPSFETVRALYEYFKEISK